MSVQNPHATATTPSHSHSSNKGMIQVLEYSPKEGEKGVPITVRLDFNHSSPEAVYLRLVVGTRALSTRVRELSDVTCGRWQLDATAPSFESPNFGSDKVPLSVQALDKDSLVIDTVTFGDFSYWISNSKPPAPSKQHRRQISADCSKHSSGLATALVGRRRAASTSTTSPMVLKCESPGHKREGSRRIRVNAIMRAKYPISDDVDGDLYPQTPVLQLVTSLDSMCSAWEPAEERAGRRLVRFTKVQDGRKLIVSCEAVAQEDFRENDSVISCIYREETDSFYVTSVDIIYLLERLANEEFPVEEKNRIRRNLEGLRPTTVSKHRAGFEDFFQRIMEFPDPKPRNIEKDLKVFEWSLLGQALDKILSKYHVFTASPTDSTVSLPEEPSDDALPYVNIDHQVVLSTKADEYPELVHPTPTTTMKFEPLYDEHSLLFLQPHDSLESLSPLADDTHFVYASTGSSPGNQQQLDEGVLSGPWTPPQRLSSGEHGIADYRQLPDFHLAETGDPAHALSNGGGPDYGSYPNGFGYSFPGIMTDPGTLVPAYY
ncbi:hypothetical protein BT96DRAFT_880148 [Gymnopus androsaceus JB14]|uniref:DUF7082 domain-containing protein n=1 Tax=Gymnopus androsaceus JB14 TaxID=1447944 RepID=A0A6A4HWF7_9AGAR|nr:hypothetical protein BT96DRAFT_880148 [Gymnopus androsaceus JB14]